MCLALVKEIAIYQQPPPPVDAVRHRSRNAAACSPSPAGSGRGARVKSAKLGSPPRDFPRSWTCSSRELTVRGSVDSPVGEIPWFLCASAEKLHARGPLPVKEIAIYYDRWEGEGSLCSLQDTDRDFPSFPIGSSVTHSRYTSLLAAPIYVASLLNAELLT